MSLDKSINLYNDDFAAEKLRGKVDVKNYLSPKIFQIKGRNASVKLAPNIDAEQATQALCGELLEVYHLENGFAWAQLQKDDYVGYINLEDLAEPFLKPNKRIKVLRTYGFKGPKVQEKILFELSMNSMVEATNEEENGFVNCGSHGWIYKAHLANLNEFAANPSEIAKMFLGSPYCWGGKESFGLDCSGLVQTSFAACGINLPRDAYMQEKCGEALEFDSEFTGLKANDLIFWKGHVAIMIDEINMIHANAYHMMVAIEPLQEAVKRIMQKDVPVRSIRRIINS